MDHGKGDGVLLAMSVWKVQGFRAMAADLTQALRSHLNTVQFRGCPSLDLCLPNVMTQKPGPFPNTPNTNFINKERDTNWTE